jgi:hypothetical protein
LEYFYKGGTITEGAMSPLNYHDYLKTIMRHEIMFYLASYSTKASPDGVLTAEVFFRNVFVHIDQVIACLTEDQFKDVLRRFLSHVKNALSIYRLLYVEMYEAILDINENFIPLMLKEALIGDKKPQSFEQILVKSTLEYKELRHSTKMPYHDPIPDHFNVYTLDILTASVHLGNLLSVWDPNKPSEHQKLYQNYKPHRVAAEHNPYLEILMLQLFDMNKKNPIKNFEKVYSSFQHFMTYLKKQNPSPKLSNSSK